MIGKGMQVCLVPDLGQDLVLLLFQLNGVMLDLREFDAMDEDIPSLLRDDAALVICDRLCSLLIPTQGTSPPRLLDPDGISVPIALRPVHLCGADLADLAEIVRTLGILHATGNRIITAARRIGAERDASPPDIIARLTALHGMLDLADLDTTAIQVLLLRSDDDEITLNPTDYASYLRLLHRISALWDAANAGIRPAGEQPPVPPHH